MILSVNQIHKSYRSDKVLKGVTFEMAAPGIVALVGPNGSGKSTLLNIITNLIHPDQGEVTVLGQSNRNPQIFRQVSFMQDNSVLYDYLTGMDHLQFVGRVHGITKEELMKKARLVGIEGYVNKKVSQYSLGMKQHLLLTLAIVNEPKLLILDEPLNGLDPSSAIYVRELLLQLAERGTAVLLSSHNLAEIDRVTSAVMFLKQGVLIKEDLSNVKRVHYQLKVQEAEKARQLLKQTGFEVEIKENQLLLSESNRLQEVLQELGKQEIAVLDMDKVTTGTEDRYKRIFFDDGE
ncbi:ABC transporter ATP-binding protein [Peribacillus sp. B-H-3]|uniref:ABC transporter ATP-binding protein n=1 Tax=Peribacillus sp. B-H-3 TaxID=3400420 RepID=UPI003B0208BE